MAAHEKSEAELTRDLIAGRMEVFEEFVNRIRSKVFKYAVLMCGRAEDAEEVVQETLLKVFENLHTLRDPEKVRSWVFRIAKNGCLMRRRRSAFAPTQEISIEDSFPGNEDGGLRLEIADWSFMPDSELLRKEMRQVLESAIRRLPDLYREVLLLRDVEELSTAETAEALGVTPEAVKTRLHRARLAVRQELDNYVKGSRSPQPATTIAR